MRSTALSDTSGTEEIPGWYIEFQTAVLRQLPRPGQIDKSIAQGWTDNQKSLRDNLSECLVPPPKWREEDGVIYFSVTSDGTTGEDWIKRLESKGFRVGDYARQVLCSPDFKPTSGVTTEVAVLKGMLFEDSNRITKKIHKEANKRKLGKPEPELAYLIRLQFTDEEIEQMGLWHIVAMHEPINDSDDGPDLLYAGRSGGGRWLGAFDDGPGLGWGRDNGFAFAVS